MLLILYNNMKYFLNRLTINGAKNIDKPIELFFSNKTVKKNIDFSNSNVKAIYGPNGSGKSGIMSTVYIYKRLIDSIDGINDSLFSRFILETINKDIKVLSIDVVFTIYGDDNVLKTNCYKHHIKFGLEDGIVLIKKEEISILKGNSILDENFRTLVKVENGVLEYLKSSKDLKDEPLYMNSINLLSKQSIVTSVLRLLDSGDDYIGEDIVIHSLLAIFIFSYNMVVEINNEDTHFDYITNKITATKYDSEDKVKGFFKESLEKFSPSEYLITLSTQNRDEVKVDDYPKYEENMKNLKKFIQIFKPDLDDIIIDKKINDDKYYCDKIFVYGNKKINVEFESTGIKKLVKLYSTLKSCANGKVAFIDEMDANLHDVYFTKLIEFFKNDSKGQLCFTTHNLEPIDVLKSNSHSLDFISNDSRVYSWVKDGNKSPMNKYVKGLIPYSPFNVESFDFDMLLDEE